MPKIRTGITCRRLSENAVAVTPLFTTFGKQPRLLFFHVEIPLYAAVQASRIGCNFTKKVPFLTAKSGMKNQGERKRG